MVAALRGMLAVLREHEDELNRLNVFPVADHDTGTNMATTLAGVVATIERHSPRDLPELATVVAEHALLEARGNSGMILAEALRGMVESWAKLERVGAVDLARGLRTASDRAWAAVLQPLEGTILSVARAAAEALEPPIEGDLDELLDRAAVAAGRAVAATPDQLPALHEAGVVDAAGRGYELCLGAMAATLNGRSLPGPPATAVPVGSAPAGEGPYFEVQYLVACGAEQIDALKGTLGALGESVVIVEADNRWLVHVHTERPGPAIEAAQRHGETSRIHVASLHEHSGDSRDLPTRR
jgi:uncharacterized protein